MEVTKLVVNGREKPKVNGNWLAYRKQLTKRINNLRKKLGVATKPRAKCAGRVEVTKDDIAQDLKFGHLLLLTSERAWANAMSMREVHLGERRSITSSTRSHIISKLQKSTIYARNLLKVLQSDNICDANVNDVLEVRAYAATLSGALEFERHKWEISLKYYAESRIIYSTLAAATKNDIYQELLSDPVDPSIRYCTYQMQISRLLSINLIAQRYFPSSDAWLIAVIERLDSGALNNELAKSRSEDDIVPSTITWRSRTINIENSVIILALVSVQMAENKLSESLSVIPSTRTRERASAYDDILTALQDAVYATKHTIDQLSQEGISDDDQRIQDLQVIQTAINYDMISWRIDRNRILLGEGDGIYLENKNYQLAKDDTQRKGKISIQKRLVRLQEKVVLYDSILQSLNSIKDLAGIAADTSLLKDINSKYDYFSSLRCLSIARSHSLLFQNRNALALFFQASSRCNSAHAYISSIMDIEDPSMKISVSNSAVERLKALLNFETQRHRALVEFSNLIDTEQNCEDVDKIPLIERLSEFPSKGVDLSNLVVYPPVLEPSPVKPLFFDAAWNYIKYPGNEIYETDKITDQVKDSARDSDKGIVSKKRWFSLGL
ncbi:putative signal recognition particle 68 kda protein [Erysiphe necator]|uniref:Signal recognition particle subunit SRP68 n=1 Tax=Uncinula necator TaxID=52586 RepID=A0A0B1P149_UNCNE|nr:putative signal recognition particle 68 kda protein [Erysiphe necator]